MIRRTLLLSLTALLFSACSGQNVFEPEDIESELSLETAAHSEDHYLNFDKGITFKDGSILTKNGIIKSMKLPEGYLYLNETEDQILAGSFGSELLILNKDDNKTQTITFSNRLLSASMHEGVIAAVDVNNEISLYDLAAQKSFFKFSGSTAAAVDVRLASPVFYEGLIFFPTLDGKVQIYSEDAKKMVRTINVSTTDNFNNIIFFKLVDKKIVAATGSALFIFGEKSIQKSLPIRSVIVDEENLIVLRKDGRIALFDMSLEQKQELKFKFAYFLGGLVKDDFFYVVEKEGYILKIAKAFTSATIYELDFDMGLFFQSQDAFYFMNGLYRP